MSKKTIKEFIEEYKENLDLRQKLLKINTLDEATFIKIVNEAGYDFTAEEGGEYANQKSALLNEKLSDDELERVSGGLFHIDLCPKKFDAFFCKPLLSILGGGCPHAKERQFSKLRGNSFLGTQEQVYYHYAYCDRGFWDEETGHGI